MNQRDFLVIKESFINNFPAEFVLIISIIVFIIGLILVFSRNIAFGPKYIRGWKAVLLGIALSVAAIIAWVGFFLISLISGGTWN